MRIISNPTDDIAVERIINVPKRGIGATTVERVKDYARAYGMDLYDAFLEVENIPGLSRAVSKIKGFTNLIEGYKTEEYENDILKLVNAILTDTGYMGDLVAENSDEANGRIENIEELINSTYAEMQANFKRYFGNRHITPKKYVYITTKKQKLNFLKE